MSNASVTFNIASGSLTLSNPITSDNGAGGGSTATGGITKAGTGTLILAGTNTYTGTTTVSAGTLSITGSIASNTTVGASGTLKGTGTITGTVAVSGTMAPGASIGTTNVVGAYTQVTGSTLEVEFDPTSTDLLNVTGSVTIQAGTTLALIPTAGTYTDQTLYTIIQTTGGVSGTFTTTTSTLSSLQVSVVYNANTVQLLISVPATPVTSFPPFTSLVSQHNPGRVAVYLDTLSPASGSDLSSVFSLLRTLDGPHLKHALDQMQPSAFKDFILMQEENLLLVEGSASSRLRKINFSTCPKHVPGLTFWIDDAYQYNHQKNAARNAGYISNTAAVSVGMDAEMRKGFYLGTLLSFTDAYGRLKKSRGKGETQTFYGGVYGTAFTDNHFDISAMVIGATHRTKTRRNIEFPGLSRHAYGAFHGGEVLGHLDFGLRWKNRGQFIRPYASGDYIYTHNSAFKEHGADSLDLSVKSANSDVLRLEGGLSYSTCFRFRRSTGDLALKAGIAHEERYLGRHYTAHLRGQGGEFRVRGMSPNRYLLIPGISYMQTFRRFALALRVDGEFGRTFYAANAGIQISFGPSAKKARQPLPPPPEVRAPVVEPIAQDLPSSESAIQEPPITPVFESSSWTPLVEQAILSKPRKVVMKKAVSSEPPPAALEVQQTEPQEESCGCGSSDEEEEPQPNPDSLESSAEEEMFLPTPQREGLPHRSQYHQGLKSDLLQP
jgi:outer membrane autotransporter protein